jgi:Acyl-CoA dehydrogenase, C-terminal domain
MFNFITEDHKLIADAARAVFEDLAALDTTRRQTVKMRIDGAVIRDALIELGLFAAPSDDASMSGAQVQALIAREAGAACLPFPVLEALAAHSVVTRCAAARDGGATGLLTVPLMDGEGVPDCRLTGAQVSGGVRLVPFAATAAAVLIRAQQRNGVDVLCCIRPPANGVGLAARATVEEDYPVHDLRFEESTGEFVVDALDTGESAAGALRQRATLLAAAEIAGVSRRMVQMTRDYLVARNQFGAPLGSNQALKHALADALVKVEAMNAAVDYAAAASDADAVDADSAISAAKLFSGRSGKAIADSMLQLHGAIGYTMEFPLQLLMRRAYRLETVHGSPRFQGARLYDAFLAA